MAAKTVKAGVEITGKDATASAFSSLSKSISKAENKFKAFKNSMSGIGGGLKIVGGLAAGAFAGIAGTIAAVSVGAYKLADSVATAADELGKFARQTGFGVEAIQELDFVAKRNGVTLEKNRAGIVKFSKEWSNLRTGAATSKLEIIDKTLAKQIKSSKTASEAYFVMLDALGKTTDPAKRSAIAFAVFGKTGQEMLRLLDGGPETLKKLREEARKYGIVTEEDTKKAEAFKDAQENLRTAVSGLKNSLAVGLFPALTDASTMLANFIAEHRSDVVQAFSGLINSTGEAIKNLVKYLADNPDAFKNFIGDAADVMKNFVDSVKDVQDFITDIKGFLGLGPDRQAVALAKADTTIEGAVPKGVGGGIVGGAKAAINDIVNKGPLELLMSGTPYLLTQAVVAGVKAGISGSRSPQDVTVRFKNLPPNAVVETDRSGPLVTEEFNYFDANTW